MLKPLRVIQKHLRNAIRQMRPPPDRALHAKVEALASALDEHRRETRLLYAALALRAPGPVPRPPLIGGDPGGNILNTSHPCRQDAFAEPWFSYWTEAFRTPLLHHRKLWEYVFICQALWERGLLRPDATGLGFGVGTEPLAAMFASRGSRIVATDMAPDQIAAAGWAATQQHAAELTALRHTYLCPAAVFDANVSFRTCDMNDVPPDLNGFDFCWSSCALEHLGSLEHGLAFIERSIECLKPGGWAVHTTEYNFGSNDDTVDHMSTVLYRRRDFEALRDRLAARGHRLAPLDFDIGSGPADTYLDVPPYRQEPCLKIALLGHATTSFGLIIQRAP